MGYVNESYDSPGREKTCRFNNSTHLLALGSQTVKTQRGYRSGTLAPQEREAIETGRTWADTRELIAYYDELDYEYRQRKDSPFVVHERDYLQLDEDLGHIQYQWSYKVPASSVVTADVDTWARCHILNPSLVLPAAPSESAMSSIAGSLMRQSVPNTRSFDLYRAIAEQRDAPRLARGLSLKGLSPRAFKQQLASEGLLLTGAKGGKKAAKKAAEAFLTYVFGVQPTLSDMVSAADAVLGVHRGIKNYLAGDKVSTRSQRTVVLNTAEQSGSTFVTQTSTTAMSVGGGSVRLIGDWLGSCKINSYAVQPSVSWSLTARRLLRQGATWEFFVPRPAQLPDRLNGYRRSAEALVGEGASPGTVYDLTPWTWLVDWFVDIGGLLHYQQAIADNQVAARSSWWSMYETIDASATWGLGYNLTGNMQMLSSHMYAATVAARLKTHKRRFGNPYNIAPSWDFSSQQWSILSALGISKGR